MGKRPPKLETETLVALPGRITWKSSVRITLQANMI